MKRKPQSPQAEATKHCILEATTHILMKEGFEALNTNKIAEKAGVSIGSLYQYFESKEDILQELMDQVIQKRTDRVKDALSISMLAASDEKIISKILDALIADENSQDLKVEAYLLPVILFTYRKDTLIKKLQTTESYLKPILKALLLIRRPKLTQRNLDAVTFILMHAIRGVMIGSTVFGADLDKKEMKKELTRLLVNFLKDDTVSPTIRLK